MSWSKRRIEHHLKAAKLLGEIKDAALRYLAKHHRATEYEVQQFILREFEIKGLKADKDPPIVAFDQSSATPHYFPRKNSRRLKPNTLILIDIWARLKKKGAPFADITWMVYYGRKTPEKVSRVFKTVIRARDAGVSFIKSRLKSGNLPTGNAVDNAVCKVITRKGYEKNILHRTGHSIGFTSPHGTKPHLNHKNNKPLLLNLGYTIEPGIYLKGRFGVRSEINFFIDRNKKIIVTTDVQKGISQIN